MLVFRADPLRDSTYRVLIRTHLAEGNTAEAIAQYRRYRDLLARRYGLEPSDELRQLVSAVCRSHGVP
jgi:DNA-binding SARP family transcriptional activator